MPSLPLIRHAVLALMTAGVLVPACAQQVVKPPVAQAWIDVATFGGLGMPGFAGGNPMAMVGSLFGGSGGSGNNSFGQTQAMSGGRWVDVTLSTRRNAQLAEAQQAVPAGFLSSALKLRSPKETKGTPVEPGEGEDRTTEPEYERPKGKVYLYWGCGTQVRAGQPRVLDFATAAPADIARIFQARRATQRGTHAAVGRPVWPSPADPRNVPEQASLVGEHAFSGAGVPENFKFQIGAAQDLMPPIALKQSEQGGATLLEWSALPTARAYFIGAMGTRGDNEMVLWTSSEQPDAGFGLLDYQTNAAVDRWLKEQVLLAPQTTRCTVPQGVFNAGQGGMLRMIAYGSELNLAYPPRPTDPKTPWEPDWAVKLRVKSVSTAMLGMDMGAAAQGERRSARDAAKESDKGTEKSGEKDAAGQVKDLLKGIFGR